MQQAAAFETVTKIDAAERQLRVAIRLFFERRDLIAVHTLAAAALDVFRQLGASRGFQSIMFDLPDKLIIPEKRKELVDIFRQAQNFFKHAGKDANAEMPFFFETTKFYLFDATRLLVALKGRHIQETAVLTYWFVAKYPRWFNFDEFPELQQVKGLAKKLNVDDFDMLVCAMDKLQLPE